MIAVLDTGANLASLGNALDALGARWQLTCDPAEFEGAERVILPGVGAAAPAMARLRAGGVAAAVCRLQQPVLGICLGLQLLCEASKEGEVACLGLLPGECAAIAPAPDRPVPHMGWNQLESISDSPLMHAVEAGAYVYFVHCFAVPANAATIATCQYGEPFSAAMSRDNFHGVQFHPERSGVVGARILKNFLACN